MSKFLFLIVTSDVIIIIIIADVVDGAVIHLNMKRMLILLQLMIPLLIITVIRMFFLCDGEDFFQIHCFHMI